MSDSLLTPVSTPAIPAVPKLIENRAKVRAVKSYRASRKQPLPAGTSAENLDEDLLLSDLTAFAKAYATDDLNLREQIVLCCKADIERDEVVDACIAGGLAEQTARNIVSQVWIKEGKRARKAPKETKLAPEVIELAAYAFAKYGETLGKKYALAVSRIAETGKGADAVSEAIAAQKARN